MPPAVLSDTRTLVPAPGLPPHLPHDCEERPDRPARARPDDRARLVGIDAARGLALLGMIAVHLIDPETDDGRMSLVWSLAAGKSAALFAVLAGVSIAFMSGRRQPYRGRRLAGAVVTVLTRAALIGGLGLALGTVVPLDDAAVILVYYATLFVLAVPFLALGPRTLLVLGAVAAIGLPWLSFWLRDGMAAPPAVNLSYATLATDPAGTAEAMLLTGSYPALPWIAYVLVGMGIGRLDLRSRGAVFRIGLVGVALAGTAVLGSSLALHPLGGLRQLAAASMGSLPFDTFSELVVWGGSGTVPTTSGWWLALASPHTGTPPDLLFTIGISCAVIAGCLAVEHVDTSVLGPLSRPGSMSLTLYSAHLLLLVSPLGLLPGAADLAIQAALLVGFAVFWRAHHDRGPLEGIVSSAARYASGSLRRPATPSGQAR